MVNSECAEAVSLKKDPPGKKDNEGTGHKASTANSCESTAWNKNTRWEETLFTLSSSHTALKTTRSRRVSQDGFQRNPRCRIVLRAEVSEVWLGQTGPRTLYTPYPSRLINLGLLWNGARLPTITFDCVSSPKGIRTSSGAKLGLEWFTIRAVQVKRGALTQGPSPRETMTTEISRAWVRLPG